MDSCPLCSLRGRVSQAPSRAFEGRRVCPACAAWGSRQRLLIGQGGESCLSQLPPVATPAASGLQTPPRATPRFRFLFVGVSVLIFVFLSSV
eukprot:NODE_861_length_1733_cov_280.661520_g705_i0.p2 GENE.NODE_861_length_1733_cov_280.661520_g705_i0~~NODE_861_length_1733_cov_280.661520_g705_i0.p2  ORF type:complete len:92 (-),score=0.68 NODE_861_length_1733_cov_280.661520_g705_i0:1234-1509(-)